MVYHFSNSLVEQQANVVIKSCPRAERTFQSRFDIRRAEVVRNRDTCGRIWLCRKIYRRKFLNLKFISGVKFAPSSYLFSLILCNDFKMYELNIMHVARFFRHFKRQTAIYKKRLKPDNVKSQGARCAKVERSCMYNPVHMVHI